MARKARQQVGQVNQKHVKKDSKNKKCQDELLQDSKELGIPSDGEKYLQSLQDDELVQHIRCVIHEAHVFKTPIGSSLGWKGSDMKKEIWRGTVKVIDRGDLSAILLVDKEASNKVVAVCPLEREGTVERCIDTSRYFVIETRDMDSTCADGRLKHFGIAFNERTDAFDFKVAVQTTLRDRGLQQEDNSDEEKEKVETPEEEPSNLLVHTNVTSCNSSSQAEIGRC